MFRDSVGHVPRSPSGYATDRRYTYCLLLSRYYVWAEHVELYA